MKKIFFSLPAAAFTVLGLATSGAAQATATATYEVKAINEVSVSGAPAALVISTAAQLAGVTDKSTTWAVTTNESSKKVTGSIDTAMPAGVTLSVNLTAPSVGTSAGSKALGIAAVDLVTGITQVEGSALGVTYTLSATPSAGVIGPQTKTVTYTIVAGA